MIYYSKVTPKGNSSYSYASQDAAETQAKYLDDNGCTDCTRCTRCTRCTDCTGAVIQAGLPDRWPAYGWKKDGKLLIHIGCQRKTLAEARVYWKDKNDRREVLAAVEYIAQVAAIKGWSV